jgi:hypothetical protein
MLWSLELPYNRLNNNSNGNDYYANSQDSDDSEGPRPLKRRRPPPVGAQLERLSSPSRSNMH